MGPLAGIRVLEIAALGPAPFCAMMLSDMGADVLRVDRKDATDAGLTRRESGDFVHRGRRTVALDLKNATDAGRLRAMVGRADVMMEGFRPGVMERLGLGPAQCLALNPRLVYARMTGWGQTGPRAHEAGHDLNYLALSGTLDMIGTAQAPVIPLNLLGDFGGGGMYLAFGIVSALYEREKSGLGQIVDAAILDGVVSLTSFIHGLRAAGEWSGERGSNLLDGGAPFYAIYETVDKKHVAIGAIEPKFFAALLDRLTIDSIAPADQWNRDTWPRMRDAFAQTFAQRSREEWCARFAGSDACFSPVLTVEEAQAEPHNLNRQVFVESNGVRQPAPAPRFSRTPGEIRDASAAPLDKWEEAAPE